MNDQTKEKLKKLNREFYEERAQEFSESRVKGWAGFLTALTWAKARLPAKLKIFDIGCGNGRAVSELNTNFKDYDYYGFDSSSALINISLQKHPEARYHFWRGEIGESLPPTWPEQYDLILLMGVMHHLPGTDTRHEFISSLKSQLKPKGVLIASFWAFEENLKLIKKAASGEKLPVHDYLLPFGNNKNYRRYCHSFDLIEVQELALVQSLRWL